MSFWTAVVVIVAILAGTIISTSKHKAKNNNADNDKTNELEKEVEALKARIVTLEKNCYRPWLRPEEAIQRSGRRPGCLISSSKY